MGRVFANSQGDHLSHTMTPKMLLDTLFNTQHDKVHIKDKVEQSREKCSALPYSSM